MTRLDFHAAVKIAADVERATVGELHAALNQLRGDQELAQISIARIEREFRGRIAARRAREMNAELPADQVEALRRDGVL